MKMGQSTPVENLNDAKNPKDSKDPNFFPENTKANYENVEMNERSSNYPIEHPEGGIRAVAIVVGSFLINGILFGVINSYSSIHCVLASRLKRQNIKNYESKSALVGSLTLGFIFLLSPLAGALTAILGPRLTTVLGGSIAAASLFISSFMVNYVNVLCVTYGLMYGLGASLAYTPSLAIQGNYFKRYLGLANGFAATGGSVFTVIFPPLMEFTLKEYGLEVLFRILAALTMCVILCGLLFKCHVPIMDSDKSSEEKTFKQVLKSAFSLEIWKFKKYRYWALFMPIALFGYFVLYIQIKKFIRKQFPDKNDNTAIMCIGGASAVGSLLFGFLADRKSLDRMLLQQVLLYAMGFFTMILPFVRNFFLAIVISLCIGIFDGGMVALIGPIIIEFCGTEYAAQAIGFVLGLVAAPLSIGPPVAGYFYNLTKSYQTPFVFAGMMPIIGASLMFIARCQKSRFIGVRR